MARISQSVKVQTILVADDDLNDSFLLELAFAKACANTSLQFVRDGEAALAYIRGEGEFADREKFPFPSMLLLDLGLPKMDGLEVLEALRSEPLTKIPERIVFTSSSNTNDIHLALCLGAVSCVFKPSHQRALEVIAKRLCKRGPGATHSVLETQPQLLLSKG
ncbi:MAG: two-component system response regulator [Pedosphaera sp.]|nr:two-component system response regulator [Pedosphaera sp.]